MPLTAAAKNAEGDRLAACYQRHRPKQTLLYRIVEEYFPAFATHAAAQGRELPCYVQRESEDDHRTPSHGDSLFIYKAQQRIFQPSAIDIWRIRCPVNLITTHNILINVPALARVEGEIALEIDIHNDKIAQLQLRIYEPPRYFKKFLDPGSWILDPRHAKYCGEWIQSHSLQIHVLAAPDVLGLNNIT
jgi:hypothetical protein